LRQEADHDAGDDRRRIEFEVRTSDGRKQLGDCHVTKIGLTWCIRKVEKANGLILRWHELAGILKSSDTKKAALKSAGASLYSGRRYRAP